MPTFVAAEPRSITVLGLHHSPQPLNYTPRPSSCTPSRQHCWLPPCAPPCLPCTSQHLLPCCCHGLLHLAITELKQQHSHVITTLSKPRGKPLYTPHAFAKHSPITPKPLFHLTTSTTNISIAPPINPQRISFRHDSHPHATMAETSSTNKPSNELHKPPCVFPVPQDTFVGSLQHLVPSTFAIR